MRQSRLLVDGSCSKAPNQLAVPEFHGVHTRELLRPASEAQSPTEHA